MPHQDSAAVVLPASILEITGLQIGDVLKATISDQQIVIQKIEETARQRLLQQITVDVLEKRRDAYRRLA